METILKSPAILFLVNLIKKIRTSVPPSEIKSFISFFLTAVLGAAVNFISQIPFKSMFDSWGIPYPLQWSVFAGYMAATVVSFIPQKNLVFGSKNSGKAKREMIKYVIIALVALVVQEAFTTWASKYIFYPNNAFVHTDFWQMKLSHVVGMGFSFLANYYGHKFLTFRSTGIYDKVKARTTK